MELETKYLMLDSTLGLLGVRVFIGGNFLGFFGLSKIG